jgi:hypothetical protein
MSGLQIALMLGYRARPYAEMEDFAIRMKPRKLNLLTAHLARLPEALRTCPRYLEEPRESR